MRLSRVVRLFLRGRNRIEPDAVQFDGSPKDRHRRANDIWRQLIWLGLLPKGSARRMTEAPSNSGRVPLNSGNNRAGQRTWRAFQLLEEIVGAFAGEGADVAIKGRPYIEPASASAAYLDLHWRLSAVPGRRFIGGASRP